MLRLLIDQDLDHDILRGLIRRIPNLDAVTAFEIRMSRSTDLELLVWAAKDRRVLLTHDRTTMPVHAAKLISENNDIAGLVVIPRRLPIHQVLDDLELIVTSTEIEEWKNVIRYLPI
jgi:uncharacterized protein DUF5615